MEGTSLLSPWVVIAVTITLYAVVLMIAYRMRGRNEEHHRPEQYE